MKRLLKRAVELGASDLHMINGAAPFLRINGEIIMMGEEPLTPEKNQQLIYSMLNDIQIKKFEENMELCFSLTISNLGFFRISIYYKRGGVEASIRIGMTELRKFDELGLPPVLFELTRKPNGLILVTGPTGHGKTTTFNALIDYINRDRRCKIITIEDPVEFIHNNNKSIIVQQEVYTDTKSFHSALIHILRQDPNIIGVGEMRDLETISAAMTAAETGHLVIATLHTNDCPQTINRIVDVFSPHQQNQIRIQLATTLLCIINQKLLPSVNKKERLLAYELMIATEAVRSIIRENKLPQLYNAITTGRKIGMIMMDDKIKEFYQKGLITYDTAVSNAKDSKII